MSGIIRAGPDGPHRSRITTVACAVTPPGTTAPPPKLADGSTAVSVTALARRARDQRRGGGVGGRARQQDGEHDDGGRGPAGQGAGPTGPGPQAGGEDRHRAAPCRTDLCTHVVTRE